MGIKVITPVATEPVTLAEAKLHLRLIVDPADTTPHPDDAMIQAQISAAREFAEHYTGRALAPQTLELALDEFPADSIELPRVPVTAITSIKYIDVDGAEQTLDAELYSLDDYGITAWVDPAYDTAWPETRAIKNAVKVRYTAGYETAPSTVKDAMLLTVAHLYENRQEATSYKVEQIPMGTKSLLNTIDTMPV